MLCVSYSTIEHRAQAEQWKIQQNCRSNKRKIACFLSIFRYQLLFYNVSGFQDVSLNAKFITIFRIDFLYIWIVPKVYMVLKGWLRSFQRLMELFTRVSFSHHANGFLSRQMANLWINLKHCPTKSTLNMDTENKQNFQKDRKFFSNFHLFTIHFFFTKATVLGTENKTGSFGFKWLRHQN